MIGVGGCWLANQLGSRAPIDGDRRRRPARREGPGWVVAAAGIALPGLRGMAGMLAKGWHGDSSDRDSELLTGFVERLRSTDLTETRIVGKLIDAGARAVKQARERDEETD